MFFLVCEERIHARGDFSAKYWRDRIIYQAEQEKKKKEEETAQVQSPVRSTKYVGLEQRGRGAEVRRAGGASWFRFLVQSCLGSYIAISGSVNFFLAALRNHQRWNKCLSHCLKVCEKKAGRSPVAVEIIEVDIMRTRPKVMMAGKERRGWI